MKKRHEQKLVIISIFLLIAFNLPLVLVADYRGQIGGMPVFYVYIFSVWALTSLFSFLIIKRYGE
ncbi:hypothetical protein [Moheibacter lacus]|uniref:DUF3311 domain-containing protein n=1 Tax=Moheibacter lacus TaxID=2745851 RepID=A0A838ZTG1_9FLAO|nr:hypothetical protein [Moheibacter lacus]MBA5630267.1 hypothetical protein [Moheibacter lacus]